MHYTTMPLVLSQSGPRPSPVETGHSDSRHVLYTVNIKQFVLCCSCVTGPNGSAAACVCVAGYEGNGTYCKGNNTHAHHPSLISKVISLFLSQSWICAVGPMVDVQSLQSVGRFQPEKGHVRVKKSTLETGSSAWVCSPDL